jgi:hypothetical protein
MPLTRERIAEFRAMIDNDTPEDMSWGELAELESAFEEIPEAELPEPREHADWSDMLDELEARLPAEPPEGYRWAREDETDRPDAVVVMLTFDVTGRRYTQDEADLAVPLEASLPDLRDETLPTYSPRAALDECFDLWASGAWPDSNAKDNLDEVMAHLERLLKASE